MQTFETTNINSKWLDNLFDNVVKLETHERFARNGVESTQEYINLLSIYRPEELKIILCDIKYKNLDNFLNEIIITIKELADTMKEEDIQAIKTKANLILKHIKDKSLFIEQVYSSSTNKLINARLTPVYYQALESACQLREDILNGINMIRHVTKGDSIPSWKN